MTGNADYIIIYENTLRVGDLDREIKFTSHKDSTYFESGSHGQRTLFFGYDVSASEKQFLQEMVNFFIVEKANNIQKAENIRKGQKKSRPVLLYFIKKVYRDGLLLKRKNTPEDTKKKNIFLSFRVMSYLIHSGMDGPFFEIDICRGPLVSSIMCWDWHISSFLIKTDDGNLVNKIPASSKTFNLRDENAECQYLTPVLRRFKTSFEQFEEIKTKAIGHRAYVPRYILACTHEEEIGCFRMTVRQIFIDSMATAVALDPYVAGVSEFGLHSIHLLISDLQRMSHSLQPYHEYKWIPDKSLEKSIWFNKRKELSEFATATCKNIMNKMMDIRWFNVFCETCNDVRFYQSIFSTFYQLLEEETNTVFSDLLKEKQCYNHIKEYGEYSGKPLWKCPGKVFKKGDSKSVIAQGELIIYKNAKNQKVLLVLNSPHDFAKEGQNTLKSNFCVTCTDVKNLKEEKEKSTPLKRLSFVKEFSFVFNEQGYQLLLAPAPFDTFKTQISSFKELFNESTTALGSTGCPPCDLSSTSPKG